MCRGRLFSKVLTWRLVEAASYYCVGKRIREVIKAPEAILVTLLTALC